MFLYIFVLCLSLLLISLGSNGRKGSLFFQVLGILVLVIIAGCRDVTVGTDTSGYPSIIFDIACGSKDFSEMVGFVEPGYVFLEYIVSRFTHDFNWFLIVSHTIILFNILLALRKYNINVVFGIFVFFCLFFNISLNTARQSIAMSFIPMAFYYFVNSRYKLFTLFFFCACIFHTSAFLCVLIFALWHFISKKEKIFDSRLTKITLIVAMSIVIIDISSVINIVVNAGLIDIKYADRYASDELYGSNFPLSNLFVNFANLLLFILLKASYKKQRLIHNLPYYPAIVDDENKAHKVFVVHEYLLIFSIIICFSALVSTFLVRLSTYFVLLNVFLLAILLCYNRQLKYKRMAVVFYAIYWIMVTYKNLGDILPYTSKILGIYE